MQFRVLGPLEVWDRERPLPLAGGKARALLAILLINVNQVVPTRRLIELLWGEERPDTARNSLQVQVSQLRKVLEPRKSKDGGRSVLISQPTGYLLRVADEELDIRRFETLTTQGREAVGAKQHQRAVGLLKEALDLWSGPPFEEFAEQPWALPETRRLEGLRLGALEDRIEAELALGRHGAVVGELEGLVVAHPLRERLGGELMLALYRSGRQAEASAVYQRTRERLVEELGMEPGLELQTLLKQILNQDAMLDLAPTPRVEPPLTNLPFQMTQFVGRAAEISHVRALLKQHRLVTLTGSGGVGKTRLALEAAYRLLDALRDGVWLVDLAPITDPKRVPLALISVLSLREQPGETTTETLATYLQERQALVLLDNCEHLILACAELANGLLSHCRNLRILATSREPLRLTGEHAWRVPSLSLPELAAQMPIEQWRSCEAVALLEQRAPVVFETPELVTTAAEICRRLDGIPLALELAATRLKHLSPQQVLNRLSDRFALLTAGSRTALPRQQTLRATIDWSYGLLSPLEKTMLRRLSVFTGGFGLEAAELVCTHDPIAAGDILELLSELTDKSMVNVEPSNGAYRYRLLETIREYAMERLAESHEDERVKSEHFAWSLDLAKLAADELHGRDQSRWIRLLSQEQDNLRSALAWGCIRRPQEALELACPLEWYWKIRGSMREGREWLESALVAMPERTHTRARALTAAAEMAAHGAGDNAAARRLAMESVEIYEERGYGRGLGWTLVVLGGTLVALGEEDEGCAQLQRSVTISREFGETWELIIALNDCGFMCHAHGDRGPDPRAMIAESVELARSMGNIWALVGILDSLAAVEFDLGDLRSARQHWRECAETFARSDDTARADCALDGFGRLAVADGDYDRALCLHAAADSLRQIEGRRLHPVDMSPIEDSINRSTEALGERLAADAWSRGRTLSRRDALEYALSGKDTVGREKSARFA